VWFARKRGKESFDMTFDTKPRRHQRPDDADAFVPDPLETNNRPGRAGAGLPASDAESFAEEFIQTCTAGEMVYEDALDEVSDEEQGGPFLIETSADETGEVEPVTEREPATNRTSQDSSPRPSRTYHG
jgi:hypothetical protein